MRKRAKAVASGKPHGQQIRVNAAFDPETFGEVASYARRHGVSFAAAVRELVEFGLVDIAEQIGTEE